MPRSSECVLCSERGPSLCARKSCPLRKRKISATRWAASVLYAQVSAREGGLDAGVAREVFELVEELFARGWPDASIELNPAPRALAPEGRTR